jgi:hypothetical protein
MRRGSVHERGALPILYYDDKIAPLDPDLIAAEWLIVSASWYYQYLARELVPRALKQMPDRGLLSGLSGWAFTCSAF